MPEAGAPAVVATAGTQQGRSMRLPLFALELALTIVQAQAGKASKQCKLRPVRPNPVLLLGVLLTKVARPGCCYGVVARAFSDPKKDPRFRSVR